MRRAMLMTALGGLLAACPVPPADPAEPSTTAEPTDESTETATETAAPSTTQTSLPADSTGSPSPDPWLEIGWGISEFNAFEGTLPLVVGPQGLAMFSMPMRGAGFYNPPNPGFDNPDMPIVEAWVDIDGYALTPDGHFNEVVDYPALFYPSQDQPGALDGAAVWLVIPDEVEPAELTGLEAHLHAELLDADGLMLTQDHDLVIGEAPEPPPGP